MVVKNFFLYLNCLNDFDFNTKIQFTMQIGDSENLQFLDIKLRIDYDNKIITEVYAKSTNSSTYVSPSK